MNRLIASHFAVAVFAAAVVASWESLETHFENDPVSLVFVVLFYGALTVYFAAWQAGAALREAKEAALQIEEAADMRI